MKNYLWNFIKGAIIGGTMSVPGVSGGTMAILLNIYDELVSAVASFFKRLKSNALFLLSVGLGGVLGVWLLSKPLLLLLDLYPQPMTYLFLGIVAGSLPMLFRKARVKRLTSSVILFPLIGAAVMLALFFFPSGLINATVGGWQAYLVLAGIGFLSAAAFVLPGISFTYVLMLFGVYELILQSVHDLNLHILIPLAIGLVIGVCVVTKILENSMTHHPQGTYLIIAGFVISSIIMQLFSAQIGFPAGSNLLLCICTFLVGFMFILLISREKKPRRR